MPLYDIKCENGHVFERHIKLEKFEEPIFCACLAPAQRLISRPMISVESVDYTCPVTGKWIGSKRAHEDNLARQGCRVLETGEREATIRRREQEEATFDAKIEATVEREVEAMPSDKRETLYNEMTRAGADVSYSRATL